MNTVEILRQIRDLQVNKYKPENPKQSETIAQYNEIIRQFIDKQMPDAMFDGEKSAQEFDNFDEAWYADTEANETPLTYRIVEHPRETTCDLCHFVNGKILPASVFAFGITAPPFHPNCRGESEFLDADGNVMFTIKGAPSSAEFSDGLLDGIQAAIDIIGLIPGVGEIADGLNAIISAMRGNYVDAALSATSMIPFVGWFGTGSKWVVKAAAHSDEVLDVAKHVDEVIDFTQSAAKHVDEAIDLAQGAAKHGDEVIDAAKAVVTKRDELLSLIKNDKLRNAINEIYREGATFGDGGLADAVRHELETGEMIGDKFHLIKAEERITNLLNILKTQSLSSYEIEIAFELLNDLLNALGGD